MVEYERVCPQCGQRPMVPSSTTCPTCDVPLQSRALAVVASDDPPVVHLYRPWITYGLYAAMVYMVVGPVPFVGHGILTMLLLRLPAAAAFYKIARDYKESMKH